MDILRFLGSPASPIYLSRGNSSNNHIAYIGDGRHLRKIKQINRTTHLKALVYFTRT